MKKLSGKQKDKVILDLCGGTGKYTPPNDGKSTAVPMEQTCHGCGGQGWVSVGVEYPTKPKKLQAIKEEEGE